jgi:hypothetical protein
MAAALGGLAKGLFSSGVFTKALTENAAKLASSGVGTAAKNAKNALNTENLVKMLTKKGAIADAVSDIAGTALETNKGGDMSKFFTNLATNAVKDATNNVVDTAKKNMLNKVGLNENTVNVLKDIAQTAQTAQTVDLKNVTKTTPVVPLAVAETVVEPPTIDKLLKAPEVTDYINSLPQIPQITQIKSLFSSQPLQPQPQLQQQIPQHLNPPTPINGGGGNCVKPKDVARDTKAVARDAALLKALNTFNAFHTINTINSLSTNGPLSNVKGTVKSTEEVKKNIIDEKLINDIESQAKKLAQQNQDLIEQNAKLEKQNRNFIKQNENLSDELTIRTLRDCFELTGPFHPRDLNTRCRAQGHDEWDGNDKKCISTDDGDKCRDQGFGGWHPVIKRCFNIPQYLKDDPDFNNPDENYVPPFD